MCHNLVEFVKGDLKRNPTQHNNNNNAVINYIHIKCTGSTLYTVRLVLDTHFSRSLTEGNLQFLTNFNLNVIN